MYYLIYLERALLLSKHPYRDWLEVQATFFDYKTSLGPWTLEAILEFLAQEYPQLANRQTQIEAFARSKEEVMSL